MTESLVARPLSQAPADIFRAIRGVCLDIDDTLTTEGKLTPEAFQALWDLKRAGLYVVPLTGRPAGWCDHFARFWPVDAVVGENGAFVFLMKDGKRTRLDPPGSDPEKTKHLEALKTSILQRFKWATWASDQLYRENDLAIDICEDVPPWSDANVQALLEHCKKAGAHAKLSSIHVNAWFGNFDKKSGFKFWLSQGAEASVPKNLDQWIFIGDSPNDEPMFEFFKNSVGVANIAKYLDGLKFKPRWLTQGHSGAGFVEMARALLSARSS